MPITSPASEPEKSVAVVALPFSGPLNEPETVPVNDGLESGAFKSSAVCCAVDTGLFASLVLVTSPSPTIDAVMPPTVPVKVGLFKFAFNLLLPSSLLKASRIVSSADRFPAAGEKPVSNLPVTVEAAIEVADCVPETSPAKEPLKLVASAAFSAASA